MKRGTYWIMLIIMTGIGYYSGVYYANSSIASRLSTASWWDQQSKAVRDGIAKNAISYVNWQDLDLAIVRKILTDVLDVAQIPHGDIAVPSNVVHSRRYVISQWQRSAVGASVIVLGSDKDGDMAVALGPQRGVLRNPQGYMEVALPKEDLTGLRQKNASRLNSKTMEAVQADASIAANAVREVNEEIGITINESDLVLLDVTSDMDASPACVAAHYMVKLENTPALKTHDTEFLEDDLSNPSWIKIKDIKYDEAQKKYFAPNNPLPLDPDTKRFLDMALKIVQLPATN